ncbi:hypothetical protein [Actinoplanes sp. DH11]|uniref:hypothetical protein n=1 Tax=Actinoplanes sp. DH11 TaxID=2857011 RepID=UPI001E506288|nr:hypothetical protein [Actinoplanes sp. DH11]
MSTERSTAAEDRAAQLSRLLAEKDDQLRLHRERPLPGWLADRRSRRAAALLPVLPLAGGLFAGTLPDTVFRSTLMTAVAALSVAGILLLRRATRLLDAVPDRLLDEREITERNAAYRLSHNVVLALLSVLALMAVADGAMRKVADSALIEGDGWIPIMVTAVLVGTMIPAAVLAWRYTEPLDDTDD